MLESQNSGLTYKG